MINDSLKLGLTLKILKEGKVVSSVNRRRKMALRHYIEANLPEKGHYFLSINYGNGNTNFGDYFTKSDLLFAYEAFTEQNLIQDLGRTQ